MKKVVKKLMNLYLCLVLLLVSFCVPVYRVEAQSIRDLENVLNAKKKALQDKKNQKELTEEQRAKTKQDIAKNEQRITDLKNANIALDKDIADLNKSMESKFEEIKKIVNYSQISSGESSVLEYIFGAKTFTDFIYRASIAEQLSKYNKKLIDSYNDDIKKSRDKKAKNESNQAEIKKIQSTLNSQYASLGEQISDLTDEMSTVEQDIKDELAVINNLRINYGCSEDEDISSCKRRALASTYIPASTGAFKRPINDAIVTGNFGWYDPYYNGHVTWHAAMDLAGNPGAKIYAAAAGKVVEVKHQSCGNHIVYIVHNIKGQRYTTGYWHMRAAYVSKGDYVTENTVIGIQGGLRSEDSCSYGQHLDFVVTTGAYTLDYTGNPRTVSSNPRNYIYFPKLNERATGVGTSEEWHTR